MKAQLIVSEKFVYDDGALHQIAIWLVPTPVPPSIHALKYRLVYVQNGRRVLGFDNERGKGDHRHVFDTQHEYAFDGLARLLADFHEQVAFIRRFLAAPSPAEPGQVADLMEALRVQLGRMGNDR